MNQLSNEQHIISLCRWDTTIDQESKAHALQEILSDFSRSGMLRLFDICFSDNCPAGQTWRIDKLVLNLGVIEFDGLLKTLSERIMLSLERELNRLLRNHQLIGSQSDNEDITHNKSDIRVLEQKTSWNELIRCFVRTGIMPWWYRHNSQNLDILNQQIEVSPNQVLMIVREEGKESAVRKRMVWQWGSNKVKQLVVMLEPFYHPYILKFSKNLCDVQAKNNLPEGDSKSFERLSWYWILTHLLVERGSLFNTKAFVKSTLMQLSREYKIEYRDLLHQMVSAIKGVQSNGSQVPVFVQAIMSVYEQGEREMLAKSSEIKRDVDLWSLLKQSLSSYGSVRDSEQHNVLHISKLRVRELFSLLYQRAPQRLKIFILSEGRQENVRKKLASDLLQEELSSLVKLLRPAEHLFITAHVERIQSISQNKEIKQQVVWEVILAHLINESGSHFNRKQFVQKTILDISRNKGISYLALLDMLSDSPFSNVHSGYRFELLRIVDDLRSAEINKQNSQSEDRGQVSQSDTQWKNIGVFLVCGEYDYQGRPISSTLASYDFSKVLQQNAVNLSSLIAELMAKKINSENNNRLIARRIMSLVDGRDYSGILRVISPQGGEFCVSWVKTIINWKGMSCLPSLKGFDVHRKLHQFVIIALLSILDKKFTISSFLTAFSESIKRFAGVNITDWKSDLYFCLQKKDKRKLHYDVIISDKNITYQREVLLWLNSLGEVGGINKFQAEKMLVVNDNSVVNKIDNLLMLLRSENLESIQPDITVKFTQVFNSIVPQYRAELVDAIKLQVDRKLLLEKLIEKSDTPVVEKWLNSLAPFSNNKDSRLFDDWVEIMDASGLWKGSSILLTQKLRKIFWLCILDSSFSSNSSLGEQQLLTLLIRIIEVSLLHLYIPMQSGIKCLINKRPGNQNSLWINALKVISSGGDLATSEKADKNTIGLKNKLIEGREKGNESKINYLKVAGNRRTDEANRNYSPDKNTIAHSQSGLDADKHRILGANQADLKEQHGVTLDGGSNYRAVEFVQDKAAVYLNHPMFETIFESCMKNGRSPVWLSRPKHVDLQRMVNDLTRVEPKKLRRLIGLLSSNSVAMFRLMSSLNFSNLLQSIKVDSPKESSRMAFLKDFMKSLFAINSQLLESNKMEEIVKRMIIDCWLQQQWASLNEENIIQEISVELIQRYKLPVRQVVNEFYCHRKAFSECIFIPDLVSISKGNQIEVTGDSTIESIDKLDSSSTNQEVPLSNDKEIVRGLDEMTAERLVPVIFESTSKDKVIAPGIPYPTELNTPFAVSNAGIVILQSFIMPYLSKLELINESEFINPLAQREAVHYLQHLVTGKSETEEQHLILNKLLCGLAITEPVERGIDICSEHIDISHSLLKAMIDYWAAIGSSSRDGFRGNWLIRQGILTEKEDNWELVVEKRAYDLLLERAPFSYSVIKYPWMTKAIYVSWSS